MSLESLFSVRRVSDSDDSEMDCAGDAVLVFEVELGHEQALVGAGQPRVGAGVRQVLLGRRVEEVLHHEPLDDLVLLAHSPPIDPLARKSLPFR